MSDIKNVGVSKFPIVGGISALVAFNFVFIPILAIGIFLSQLTVTASTAAACAPGVASGGASPLENPTREQVAGAIYAQAMGLGLGEVAAYIGIGVGISETGLSNNTTGDCWTATPQCSLGRTGSRGVFQQFAGWVPPGLEWSGLPAPTGGYGTDYGLFNERNAWGVNGWARNDPRMNVHQAANMFFLGPNYSATAGLEDDALFQSVRSRAPEGLSPDTVFNIAHNVQGFPIAHKASYIANFFGNSGGKSAISYLKDIKEGRIPVPPFVAPLEGMLKSATTPETKKVVSGLGSPGAGGGSVSSPSPSPSSPSGSNNQPGTPIAASRQDGLLLVGDSLMEGIVTMGGAPREAFGGTVITRSEVGIGTASAINKWKETIRNGPSRILVSLGSNDSVQYAQSYAAAIDQFMSIAGGNRDVYWFTMHYKPVLGLNNALKQADSRYRNLHLVDVTDLIGPGSGLTSSGDNYLHPSPAGYKAMWNAALSAMQGESAAGAMIMSSAECAGYTFSGVGANPLAQAALAYAVAQEGKPYSLSASPPITWDCSKLTGWAYQQAWVQAGKPTEWAFLGEGPFYPWALSYGQYKHPNMRFVPIDQAMPGDFIFWNLDAGGLGDGNPIDHVALILDPQRQLAIEAGSPVGQYSYADDVAKSGGGRGVAGPPDRNGEPILPGQPGWEPVVGRLVPDGAENSTKGSGKVTASVALLVNDSMVTRRIEALGESI